MTNTELRELIERIQVDIDREELRSGGPDDGNPWHTFITRISDVKLLFAELTRLSEENERRREALRGAIELLDDCEISHPFKWDAAVKCTHSSG